MNIGPTPDLAPVDWPNGVRIIRALYPPIDLFEDIADPADWPLILSAEAKTNPRIMENVGNLDLVPPARRVSGPGASLLMAPFTHVSPDRPSRFSAGRFGVLYVASDFETALAETMHHHARFMAATEEPPGWTSQFREVVMRITANLHDIRPETTANSAYHDPDSYAASQTLGADLQARGSDGITYRSVRGAGTCVALFYPDLANDARAARPLDYHWNGTRVDMFRDLESGQVYRVS